MGKSKTTPRPVPSDDSKVVGTAENNVTPIKGRARRQATDGKSVGAKATDSAGEVGAADVAPAVVVFGKDESGKAHASRFGASDAELAIKAAGLMGYQVLRVSSPEIASKALEVTPGRIFENSGRGFVPFCRTALYEALSGFEGAFAPPPPPEPEPEPPLVVTGTPQRWEDLQVGSIVLASTGENEGWFEAIIAEARVDAIFVLRWQGWADHDPFVRRADGLALLPAPPVEAAVGG